MSVSGRDLVSKPVYGDLDGNMSGNDEAEYESDDGALPLAMRRREASDDEEGDEENSRRLLNPRVGIGSDSESDGQGGVQVYEEEELEEELEEEEEEVDEEEEVEQDGDFEEDVAERVSEGGAREIEIPAVLLEAAGVDNRRSGECSNNDQLAAAFCGKNQLEEEKKENEPFAVPTAGAFYMHDDRFRDNGGARHRRTPGGRKLWESKDDRAWVHDRFEEMNLQEMPYEEERRTSKGYFRGRGRSRASERGFVRGNRPRGYDDSGNQNRAPKGVKGRGPRRYEPPAKNNSEILTTQSKQSGKSVDATASSSSGRVASHTSNTQSGSVLPRKHVFASRLSSASPPFYPSGSSNQDIPATQKRDPQAGTSNRNLPPLVLMDENVSASTSNSSMRRKNIVDASGQDRLYMDHSLRPITGKMVINASSIQSTQFRVQGKGLPSGPPIQLKPSLNHVNKSQPVPRTSPQQVAQRTGSASPPPSPPRAPSTDSSEVGATESPPGSSRSKTALVGKGKDSIQGRGRGSFLYNSAQLIGANGAMAVAHGDQGFPPTPALLPVMQFGGQHHGGLGVPAVGMALPGYVAQPQLGFGNSEMTWVPVLAGAAGALGASYCSPYIAVDGGYYGRSSGQTSSLGASSRDTHTNKPAGVWKPPQRPDLVNDEFGQRQNKPRRYSEMNFGQ